MRRATAGCPRAGWMFGHIEVEDSSTVMRDDEKAVESANRERRHGKEIHGGDCFRVIAQKRRPSFAGSGLRGALPIQRSTVRSEI